MKLHLTLIQLKLYLHEGKVAGSGILEVLVVSQKKLEELGKNSRLNIKIFATLTSLPKCETKLYNVLPLMRSS